jgi:hypothetical protein
MYGGFHTILIAFTDYGNQPGIVVSCASAFRQLFMASNRSNSKPVWTTTDRFYDRMISSFQSKNKSPDEVNLYDIPDTNQMGESFDYVSMRKGSEAAS